jgi:hypothetical protein
MFWIADHVSGRQTFPERAGQDDIEISVAAKPEPERAIRSPFMASTVSFCYALALLSDLEMPSEGPGLG